MSILGLRSALFQALEGRWKNMYVVQSSQWVFLCMNSRARTILQSKELVFGIQQGSSQGPMSSILDDIHLSMSKLTQSNLNHSFRHSNTPGQGYISIHLHILQQARTIAPTETFDYERQTRPLQCSLKRQVNVSMQPNLINVQGRPQMAPNASVRLKNIV